MVALGYFMQWVSCIQVQTCRTHVSVFDLKTSISVFVLVCLLFSLCTRAPSLLYIHTYIYIFVVVCLHVYTYVTIATLLQ